MSPEKKTFLVRAYTHLNIGDDLFLKILIERYPNANFVLIGKRDKYRKIFPGNNVSFFRFPRTWIDQKLVRKILFKFFFPLYLKLKNQINKKYLNNNKSLFDGIITIGGSIFMQPNKQSYYKNNLHFLFADVFASKPKFILGANFGPFNDKNFLNVYHNLFREYDDVSFRDTYSKSLFAQLDNVRCSPDVVFSLKTEDIIRKEKTVGFSLIDLSLRLDLSQFTESYEAKILQLIENYIQKNYTVYLFSFCKSEGDENVINRIIGKLQYELQQKIKTVFYDGQINVFVSLFQSMEVMYATRFHAMILSLISDQKTVPIIYSKKMRYVLDDISFSGKCIEIENLNDSECHANELLQTYKLPLKIRHDAERHFEKLDIFLNYKSHL